MKSVQVLGFCGLLSAALSAAGGFAHIPELIGVGSVVMIGGNLFAFLNKDS